MKLVNFKSTDPFLDSLGTVCISEGVLAMDNEATNIEEVYDCSGFYLCPGFFDLQLYGAGGYVFDSNLSMVCLERISVEHERYGTTSFLITLPSTSLENILKGIDVVRSAMQKGTTNVANEVLSDPEKRKKYDKYGKDWKHADEYERAGYGSASQSRSSGNSKSGNKYSDYGFSDFFESMFGGEGGRNYGNHVRYRGQDLNAELHLDLKDIFTTHKRTLTIQDKTIRINIPAGVEDGQVIKIANHGGEGLNGGPNGDLFLTFVISNPGPFKRQGAHLYKEQELDLYTAVLGGEIMVDTFDGKVKLNVKPCTQNGTKVKLKGKGFPVYKSEGEFGDLYITFQVKLPTHLSDSEIELFKQLSKLHKT